MMFRNRSKVYSGGGLRMYRWQSWKASDCVGMRPVSITIAPARAGTAIEEAAGRSDAACLLEVLSLFLYSALNAPIPHAPLPNPIFKPVSVVTASPTLRQS